jgi:hypothetical protein
MLLLVCDVIIKMLACTFQLIFFLLGSVGVAKAARQVGQEFSSRVISLPSVDMT